MTDLPRDAVTTELVSLELIDADAIDDMLASVDDPSRRHTDWHPDYPREDDRDGVGLVGEVNGWSSRQVRRLSDGLVVGSIGFFGPPDPVDGVLEAEVGYGLVERARGQGLMRSALPALLALTDAAGVRVRGATMRDNAASLASMRGAGFVVREASTDDPEREVVLVREVSR